MPIISPPPVTGKNTTRVTATPYAVLPTDYNIYVDTDSAGITVNLPAGTPGKTYRVINVGSSGNDITLNPNGAELLKGANSAQSIADGNDLLITYQPTEGWW